MAEYDINYEDERFQQVESDKTSALSNLEKTYADMINNTDKYYQDQINASQQWADKQSQLQQEKTDFTIEQIEQQKAQAQKDYTKEQSGAYVDWRKQSNEYGTEAEKMASAGLQNTGYSESSQVSMYNTYQNRVASARESYNQAVLNYNNAIKDARLHNNAALAEIAYQALQTQLELSLQGFQYKNNLILEQTNKKLEVDQMYYNRYQDVLEQINRENAVAEEVRQFNLSYEQKVKEYEEGIRQFNEEIARLKENDAKEYELAIQELELKKQQLEEEKRQFDTMYSTKKKKSSGGGGGGGGGDGGSGDSGSSGNSDANRYAATAGNAAGEKTGFNMQSLIAAGAAGQSVDSVAKQVASGNLNAAVLPNGQIAVSRNNSTVNAVTGNNTYVYQPVQTTPTKTQYSRLGLKRL